MWKWRTSPSIQPQYSPIPLIYLPVCKANLRWWQPMMKKKKKSLVIQCLKSIISKTWFDIQELFPWWTTAKFCDPQLSSPWFPDPIFQKAEHMQLFLVQGKYLNTFKPLTIIVLYSKMFFMSNDTHHLMSIPYAPFPMKPCLITSMRNILSLFRTLATFYLYYCHTHKNSTVIIIYWKAPHFSSKL